MTGIETSSNDNHTDLDKELAIFDFSHYPLPVKATNSIRVFYNNINSLEINSAIAAVANNKKNKNKHEYTDDIETYTKIESFLKQMSTWDVDISLLSEPCVEWRDSIPRKVIKDIAKKYDQYGTWTVATSSCYSGSFFKPGGSLIYTKGHMVGRIIDKGTDPWGYGRWSFMRYQGKLNTSLLVISAYRVGQRNNNAGPSTAWYQQKVLLTQSKRDESPDMAFIKDIEEWYKLQNLECTEVIMMLDANEKWTNKSQIKQLASRLQLFNLNIDGGYDFPATHPCITNPSRDTTIDYCLCTKKVIDATRYATLTPFDLHSLGDHRGMLLDLDIKTLLSVLEDSQIQHMGRKLATGNIQATEKYLQSVDKGFIKQNIYNRSQKLYHRWNNKELSKWEVMILYDKLDKEIFHICRKAEAKCRTMKGGKYEWSPALAKAIKTLTYWRARKKYANHNRLIENLGNELEIPCEYQNEDKIQQMINISRENLQKIQEQSIEYRRKFLEDRANKYAQENNMSKANAISELISHESVRSTFQFLREKLKKGKRGQLQRIWIAYDNNGNHCKDQMRKIEIEKDTEVHEKLLQRNKKHLGQAKKTPFAQKPWSAKLKWDGTGDLGRDILSGDILNQQKFSSTVQLYFESLKTNRMSSKIKTVRASLSLEEYKKFWRKKREDTVTSPFGLHVGHFKAAVQREEILNVHRIMLLIPFQTSLVPYRWKKTVQTMLEKDPGQPWIHRLRIIELFDSQLNAGFQIFIGRKMVWNAVKEKKLHNSSFGSTPGKMASSALLQKILSIDQLRLERRVGGLFDCDATGCYDRILPPLAAVHLNALGLDPSISTMLARLMYVAKRHVKTKHGVSKKYIQTTINNPLFGIGQGNGGGPAIWLAHLTIMFTALSAICSGFVIKCIQGIQAIASVGTGYVDDVTLITNVADNEPQTEQTARNKIKYMARKWEKLLYLTGGKLELSKCFWIPVTWRWKRGNPIIQKARVGSKELILTESESGRRITIPRISPGKAEKRLGVWYCIDGNWQMEYKNWKEFTKSFADKLAKARVDRLGGSHAYKSLWCAKFRYIAPVVGLTKHELLQIQKTIIGRSLSASGYSSKMPRAVVFGPAKYGGMQWESPYSITLYEQLKIFIGSIRLGDTVGKILKIQLQWLQIHAGTSVPIMEESTGLNYIQDCWLKALHLKMVESNVKVHIADIWIPTKIRKNDIIIMDYVKKYLPEDYWGPVNQCRLYMRALTVSDLTTYDGTIIPESVYKLVGPYRESRLSYPIQQRPRKNIRKKWEYFIQHITEASKKVLIPLGSWIKTPYQYYPFAETIEGTFIFQNVDNIWEIYCRQDSTRNEYKKMEIKAKKLPTQWTPVQVIRKSCGIIRGISSSKIEDTADPNKSVVPGTFEHETINMIIGKSTVHKDQWKRLAEDWATNSVEMICGSDGGLKENLGTSGYVLYRDPSDNPILTGYSAEAQYGTAASSTRQELLAQLCIEYWLEHFFRLWGPPKNTIRLQVITDSQASLIIFDNLKNIVSMKEVLRPDIDVAMELARIRKQNATFSKLELIKVQSHIEKDEAPNETYWSVNKEADELATFARDQVQAGNITAHPPQFLTGTSAIARIDGRLGLSEVKQQLHTSIYRSNLAEYLMRKYDWTCQTFESIDWSAQEVSIQKFPPLTRITVFKLVHGWLATARRRCREGFVVTPQCSLCKEEENRDHMFCCSEERISNVRRKELLKLKASIFEITEPIAGNALIAGIQSIINDYDVGIYSREFASTTPLADAMEEQQTIGWNHFLQGRMSLKWKLVGPLKSFRGDKDKWAQLIVAKTINFGLAIWKQRNVIVHGTDSGVSKRQIVNTLAMIDWLYQEILPIIDIEHKWLFMESLEKKLAAPYSVQVAWVDSIRRLYPVQYGRCKYNIGKGNFTQHTLEYIKETSLGLVGR